MNTSGIEALLDKYYEGNTTLQEEKILRDFFQSESVPDQLKSHQLLFRFFTEERIQEVFDPDFEKQLTDHFNDDYAETYKINVNSKRNRFIFLTGIAAGILLLIGIYFTIQHESFRKSILEKGNTNPGLAYNEASEALMILSSSMNSGLKEVTHLQMIDNAITSLQSFNKFYQYQQIIINPDEIQNQSIKSK